MRLLQGLGRNGHHLALAILWVIGTDRVVVRAQALAPDAPRSSTVLPTPRTPDAGQPGIDTGLSSAPVPSRFPFPFEAVILTLARRSVRCPPAGIAAPERAAQAGQYFRSWRGGSGDQSEQG